jgi:dCTP deaminase
MAVHARRLLMVLSDVDIRRYIELGKIRVVPELPPEQFGSCSIDLRLGSEFSIFEHSRYPYIDVREKGAIQDIMRTVIVKPGEPFILQPREFALAITEESLELDDDVLGRLEGRSSLGRIGIIVHGTAGLFDPGWRGKATLELSNLGIMPVALYPGMRICSFTFEQLSSPVSVPYYKKAGNKYAGQTQPLASKLMAEVDKKT